MSDSSHIYIAIDLKSFYASVECVERECDPLTTNLVVADESRTEKTICLAVSPSLKAYGIPGRARLFEVVQKVKQINKERRSRIAGGVFTGKSANAEELKKDPTLELTYIAAPPRMALYMEKNNQHQFSYNFFTRCVFREHYSGRSRRYFQAMATAGIFHSPPLDSQPAGFIKAIGYIPHPSL